MRSARVKCASKEGERTMAHMLALWLVTALLFMVRSRQMSPPRGHDSLLSLFARRFNTPSFSQRDHGKTPHILATPRYPCTHTISCCECPS
jgi:hypothetical protein